METSLEESLDLIPEDAPSKVMTLLTTLKEKIIHQTTAIDLKKKLISNQESEKQEIDEKITALELQIRHAKALKGESTSDMQEKARLNQDGLEKLGNKSNKIGFHKAWQVQWGVGDMESWLIKIRKSDKSQ